MHRLLSSSLVLCALFAVTPTCQAGTDAKPRAIVEKAIKAHGGKKAKFKAQTTQVKGMIIFGGQKQKYTAVYTHVVPNKFRFDLVMEMKGKKIKLTAASDGKTAWEQMGEKVRVMDKKKTLEFNHNVYSSSLARLFPLRNKKYKLTSLGESKIGDKTVVGIRVQRKGKRDVSLYFDKKTWLLAKTKTTIINEFTGKKATQEGYFTGYRDKDGAKVFDNLTIKLDGKEFIIEEYSNQRRLERVDPKLFVKPGGGEK